MNNTELKMLFAYMAGITLTLLSRAIYDYNTPTWTQDEVEQLMQEQGYNEYNQGYKEGMLYAYDNVVICGASPEDQGIKIARLLGKPEQVSDIICTE